MTLIKTSALSALAVVAKLASALTKRGIGKSDTVSVMLSNTPPMLEAHYAVPMIGGVPAVDPPDRSLHLHRAVGGSGISANLSFR